MCFVLLKHPFRDSQYKKWAMFSWKWSKQSLLFYYPVSIKGFFKTGNEKRNLEQQNTRPQNKENCRQHWSWAENKNVEFLWKGSIYHVFLIQKGRTVLICSWATGAIKFDYLSSWAIEQFCWREEFLCYILIVIFPFDHWININLITVLISVFDLCYSGY